MATNTTNNRQETDFKCEKCGKYIIGTFENQDLCKCMNDIFGFQGWVCPVCGVGLSPFISICPCRNPRFNAQIGSNFLS